MDMPPFDFATENLPLAPRTYYKVGGPARLVLEPRNASEAGEAYRWMLSQPERCLILGYGSNVLIADGGFPGIVLFTGGLCALEPLGNGRYRIESGIGLDRVVREILVAHNFEGTGALTGIPGSVGGAIYMNAGTVNGSTCDLLETVDLIGPGGPCSVDVSPPLYGYRCQTFCPTDHLILAGLFRCRPAENDQKAVYDHYMQRRRERQPQGNCCGSVFKNPENEHAGRLIEACGLKGTRRGGAMISTLHANFIINEDGATCEDILGLIDLCKRRVHEQFGIELREEVRIIT